MSWQNTSVQVNGQRREKTTNLAFFVPGTWARDAVVILDLFDLEVYFDEGPVVLIQIDGNEPYAQAKKVDGERQRPDLTL